tara:strand:- start:481 stop:624 length:144 start_codon:yes stop_codon:yes gene_type:complete
MSDFISGFFSWGKLKKGEEPKEKEIIEIIQKEPLRYPRIYQAQKEEE